LSLVPYHDVFKSKVNNSEVSKSEDVKELVLLHGWGMHSGLWDEILPELLQRFNVTVIDLPGMGRSPMSSGTYDLASLCEQVLLAAPEKAVWVGWSLGGMIALKIAADHPARVTALINVASTPKFSNSLAVGGDDDWPKGMPHKSLDGFVDLFEEDWEGTVIRFLALQCKDSSSYRQDVRKLRDVIFFYGQPAKKALREGLVILRDQDLRSELASLTQPILYLFGENDNLISPNMSNSIQALNANVNVAMVSGASHIPFLSHPDSFLNAIGDFVTEQLK